MHRAFANGKTSKKELFSRKKRGKPFSAKKPWEIYSLFFDENIQKHGETFILFHVGMLLDVSGDFYGQLECNENMEKGAWLTNIYIYIPFLFFPVQKPGGKGQIHFLSPPEKNQVATSSDRKKKKSDRS